ncbi:dihydrofolate reductase [Candidatus Azambacteria bacterium]|nr:dihydrofolate reductase [Candidatus Azambacteria bacterium]
MINLIAAVQKKDNGLGYQNKLLFKISGDLKRFKDLTTGNVIIMGRKTFESIGQPLPNRTNIIISRNSDFHFGGIITAETISEAIGKASLIGKEIFIIGGAEIYKQTLPVADRLYLTLVDGNFEADVFFPDWSMFKKIISQETGYDEKNKLDWKFLILEK